MPKNTSGAVHRNQLDSYNRIGEYSELLAGHNRAVFELALSFTAKLESEA
jgi:hypothetical protein